MAIEVQPTIHDTRQSATYGVEVSGWDLSENFFVEKAQLHWGHKSGQQLHLKTRLREGSVVFVRLLQVLANEANFPIAYLVQKDLRIENDGCTVVEISRLHPKPSIHQAPESVEPVHAEVA